MKLLIIGGTRFLGRHLVRLPEEAAPHLRGFMFINADKAIAAGLNFRSLSDTISDTLAWRQANQTNEQLSAGLTSDKERMLLSKIKASRNVL